jgi:hypothetical protein
VDGEWLGAVAVLLEEGTGLLEEGARLVLADAKEVGEE